MVGLAALLNIFIGKNLTRFTQRGFRSTGQHFWSQSKKQYLVSGRGLAGNQWECKSGSWAISIEYFKCAMSLFYLIFVRW